MRTTLITGLVLLVLSAGDAVIDPPVHSPGPASTAGPGPWVWALEERAGDVFGGAAAHASQLPRPPVTPGVEAPRAPGVPPPVVAPLVGYADLHVHQFTNESMAGAWMYGSAVGPAATALARCSGNVPLAPGRNHGTLDKTLVTVIGGAIGLALFQSAVEGMGSDTGLHAGRRHGWCQANSTPGPGLCRGNVACNWLSQAECSSSVCEWRSTGSACRDKPGDGIGVGLLCNSVGNDRCENTCSWDSTWHVCRGNVACNKLSKSQCKSIQSNVCSWQSLGSMCRDRDGDGKSVGLACNTLGPGDCGNTCSWDASWGSITLHQEERGHDWTHSDGHGASWPAWDAIAHQQVHIDWLYQAYQDGLRLMVMSALNNEAFCAFMPLANRAPGYGCGDLENVSRQLKAAQALHNAPSSPWYQVAYTAAEARDIIRQNKLAVILSVEASDIFNTADPLGALQGLYNQGVRTLQPLHQFNNRLGGAAWHERSMKIVQTIKNLPSIHQLCKTAGGTGVFGDCDAVADRLNYIGLTHTGRRFVTKMLNLGMPLDVAHLSERGVRDVEPIVTAACNYPVYVSHGHARALLDPESWKANQHHEKSTPDWQLDLIRKTGGMFGLRTGADHHRAAVYRAAIAAAGLSTTLPDKEAAKMGKKEESGGSEFHFAYALDYLHRVKGVSVALGSDLNGLIPQMVFDGESHDAPMAGLAHIGKLKTMFTKLAASGLDKGTYTQLRQNSAEAYVKMWERAAAFASGTSCCPTPTVASVVPSQAWFGRPNRLTIVGTNFTPHQSMQVTLRAAPSAPAIACTDVEFVSSAALRCTAPVLGSGASYAVTVRNGGCGLEATKASVYQASAVDTGLVTVPVDTPFTVADLLTVLADPPSASNARLAPSASKNAAVDWNHPAWAGMSQPAVAPADRPMQDGRVQRDWDAAATSPNRPAVSPALEMLLAREDSALMTDTATMIGACDAAEATKGKLAAANRWPADWRAQMASLCKGDSHVCAPSPFTCPGGAAVARVGQVAGAATASCPFDVGATYATCPAFDNLAMGGLASFSAPASAGGEAWRAVDNGTDGVLARGSVAMIGAATPGAWWQVDLGSDASVAALSLHNRTDCCADRVKQFYVQTSTDGTAWTNQFQQEAAIGPVANIVLSSAVTARYVRLQFYAMKEPVNLAEVKVWGSRPRGAPGANVALGKPAALSSGYYQCQASNAVNGNLGGTTTTAAGCTTAVSGNTPGAWWQVDLGATTRNTVTAVRIWNRQDCPLAGCIDRLKQFAIQTSNDGVAWTTQVDHPATLFTVNQMVETVVLPRPVTARFVRIGFNAGYQNHLQLNEVEVLGTSVP